MRTTLFELLAVTAFATLDGFEVDEFVAPAEQGQRYVLRCCRGDFAAEFYDQELDISEGQDDFAIKDYEGNEVSLGCFGERPRIQPQHIIEARIQSQHTDKPSSFFLKNVAFDCAPAGTSIPAYVNDKRWNGWLMPYFPVSSMPVVMAVCGDVSYDEGRDVYVVRSDEAPEDAFEVPAETITTADGLKIKVYPVGAGAWTWEAAD